MATVTGAGFLSNITDLSIATVDGRHVLYSATHVGGGITAFQIGQPDVQARVIGASAYDGGVSYWREPRVNVLQMGGANLVAMSNTGSTAMAMKIASSGMVERAPASTTLKQIGSSVVSLGQFSTSGGDFVFATREKSTSFMLYRVQADGGMSAIAQSSAPPQAVRSDAALDFVLPVKVNAQQVLVSLSATGNFISSHVIAANGAIRRAEYLGSDDMTGFAGPRIATAVTVGGVTYVTVGASHSSSLTVFSLSAQGSMSAVDHVIDEGSTRFLRVTAIDSVVLDGRAYVFAGGADNGITMLLLRPDGRLVHLQTLADDHGLTLARVSAIKAQVIDGKIVLFVTSAVEAGITQLVVEPGKAGITGVVAGTNPSGTPHDDYMIAGPDAIWMGGGAGNDTLVAGDRSIALLGGPGADTFVPANINGRMAIRDFEVGVDRLDFSNLGMVRSIYQMTILPQTWGARIRFHDTVIDIYTSNGRSLPVNFFTNDMFAMTRYDPAQLPAIIYGSAGNDMLRASPIGSTIHGRGGHDVIFGSDQPDILHGEDGNDTINGGGGDDTIFGGNGDDRLRGGAGDDVIHGGPGNDILWGDAGHDSLMGDGGHDTIFGGPGNDTLRGGVGNDRLFGNGGHDLIYGDGGHDRLEGGAGNDTLYGGPGRDTLLGGPGNDVLHGGAGPDLLRGGGGHDLLRGDGGNDSLYGGAGRDTLYGGPGHDLLDGGAGDDMLFGGAGRDTLRGGPGNDLLEGGPGNDRLFGGIGHDTIRGGPGHDLAYGGPGNDSIFGDAGNDTLYGDAGHDYLDGGAGDDRLFGGPGNDTLRGGLGADLLNGGPGLDVFFYGEVRESAPRFGIDIIEDFTRGQDRIDLTAIGFEFIGADPFSAAGQLRADYQANQTVLRGDVNGDGVADFVLILRGAIPIDHSDLLL